MEKKDWIGTSQSVFATMAATNHFEEEREVNDYYATEPKAVKLLLELEKIEGTIWECACGEGHLSKEMERLGYDVISTDLVWRGFGDGVYDFISPKNTGKTHFNIITNPPFVTANDFILKGLEVLGKGKKMALFLPIRYLEGKSRGKIFKEFPPYKIYISRSRLQTARNGQFNKETSAVGYAWFVWRDGFKGKTELKWFN